MRSHLFRWAILVWAGIWLAFGVEAQAQSTRSNRSPTLINQLDQFGRSLFGIRNKEQPTATANQQPMAQPHNAAGTTRAAPQAAVSNGAGMAIETGTSVRMHQSGAAPSRPAQRIYPSRATESGHNSAHGQCACVAGCSGRQCPGADVRTGRRERRRYHLRDARFHAAS